MPVFNAWFQHQPLNGQSQPNPQAMHVSGPVIPVQIEVPTALAASMQQAGQPIPTPITGMALIDTGATFSAADAGALTALGVQPAGAVGVWGVGGATQQSLFPARLSFPGTGLPTIDFSQISGASLSGAVTPQGRLVALIGRDILAGWVLIYNGPGAIFTVGH